jgi:membrane fusion protein (multidrug efflux system)
MRQARALSRTGAIVRKVSLGIGFAVVVVILLLWLANVFVPKIGTGQPEESVLTGRPVGETALAEARLIRVPVIESAVGTIRAVHETSVASKLLAKVAAINVQAGQSVRKGDVLVRLDDEDLQARLEQAEAGLASAVAARDQAQIEHQRTQRLFEQNAAAQIELERAATSLKSAEAEVERAQQARREAGTVLDYATIRSPLDAIVVDKLVEAGDTAQPGQVLVSLYDPSRMQLVASVRESLTHRLKIGQSIAVEVDALDKVCQGQVSEIVPEAESASRTFSVKVTGPCPAGIYSGMFGRLLIPLDEQEVLVIPQTAVRRVGQLTIVDVADGGGQVLCRRAVQLGRTFGTEVEVLAGLRAGERVGLLGPVPADSTGEPS